MIIDRQDVKSSRKPGGAPVVFVLLGVLCGYIYVGRDVKQGLKTGNRHPSNGGPVGDSPGAKKAFGMAPFFLLFFFASASALGHHHGLAFIAHLTRGDPALGTRHKD